MNIEINEEITSKLKERVENTDEFKDVEEYVNYILKQVTEKLGTNTNTVPIPDELANNIKEKIKDSGFTSLSSYVIYVLRQAISGVQTEEKETLSEEDKKLVEDRLRDLGYVGLKMK